MNKKLSAIIMQEMNRLGIIWVFINAFINIGPNHVMKHLKNIAYHSVGFSGEHFEKFLKEGWPWEGESGSRWLLVGKRMPRQAEADAKWLVDDNV